MDFNLLLNRSPDLNPRDLSQFNNIDPEHYYFLSDGRIHDIINIYVKNYLVVIEYFDLQTQSKHRQLRITGHYKVIWGLLKKPHIKTAFKELEAGILNYKDVITKYKYYQLCSNDTLYNINTIYQKIDKPLADFYIICNKYDKSIKIIRNFKDYNKSWWLVKAI
jgi:hypothetical protein